MSNQYTHTCTKCRNTYSDNDVEAYLCEKCKEEKKVLAEQIEAQIASRPKKEEEPSELESLIRDPRTIFKNGGHTIFIRESQL